MNERERFVAAFNTLLEKNPRQAPGPTAINRLMGGRTSSMNKLPGRLSGLRREMLKEAGFRYVNTSDWGMQYRWRL